MNIKGKRIFNKRPMCFFAAFLICGIIIGESLVGENPLFRLIPLIVGILAIVLCFTFKKSRGFAYVCIAFVLGVLAICGSNDIFASMLSPSFDGKIVGTVSSEIVVDKGKTTFEIDDVTINGKTINFVAYVTVAGDDVPSFGAGSVVEIDGELTPFEREKFDTFFATNRANGLGYSVYALSAKKLADVPLKFPLNLQIETKKLFDTTLDARTASICKALVLGDKAGMNKQLYDNVKASGLAHVLAVSGLHVTTLSSAIYFLLKKLKVNSKIAYVVVLILTFAYSMLCSFTASSLRAVVMTAVCGFASAFGKKGDNLSSLALAASIILIARPTALMEIGFHLSFFAVLGIFLFYHSFKKTGMVAIDKISPVKHRGEKLVDACSLTLSSNLMTYPLVAYFFKEVPTMFLISSIVMLPYVVFVYVVTLVVALFSLITGVGGATIILQYLLVPFRLYVDGVGSLSFATLDVAMSIIGVVTFSILFVVLSRFVFAKRSQKAVAFLTATSVLLVAQLIILAI